MDRYEFFMKEALKEARRAYELNEIPIGAVVVKADEIIGRGHNLVESENNSLKHAEMIAMEEACKKINNKYLNECEIYVTVEPCAMCSGAILNSRIKRLIYGVDEPKTGSAGSLINILQFPRFNHFVAIKSGILEEECKILMNDFFNNLRKS